MDLQTLITIGIGIIALACFFGTMMGVQRVVGKFKDPRKALETADDIVDTVSLANDTLQPLIPSPVESIIDTVLKVTQAGVHSVEQLYQRNQLPPDLRKDKAVEYAINMIKLSGREVTPELEQSIRDTAEGAVFIMKQQEQILKQLKEQELKEKQKQKEQQTELIMPTLEQRSPILKTELESLPVIVN